MNFNPEGRLVQTVYWKGVERLCRTVVGKLESAGYASGIDCIVAIANGGIIPAGIIMKLLSPRPEMFQTIGIKRYTDFDKGWPEIMYRPSPAYLRDKQVLLVDDIVDVGETLKLAYKYLKKHCLFVSSVALFARNEEDADVIGMVTPNWIKFPWEQGVE